MDLCDIIFAAICSIQLVSGADNYLDNSRIVFPGPTNIHDLNRRYGSDDSKGNKTHPCAGLSYCAVKPDDYPQELFDNMFKGKYKEPIFQPTYIINDNRQGDSDDKSDCEGVVTNEPLFQVRDKDGDWVNVVQAPKENFVQTVRIETCNNYGRPCFTSFDAPIEKEAYCVQKYGTWEFLIHDGKETRKSTADLPTCCVCIYKNKL